MLTPTLIIMALPVLFLIGATALLSLVMPACSKAYDRRRHARADAARRNRRAAARTLRTLARKG